MQNQKIKMIYLFRHVRETILKEIYLSIYYRLDLKTIPAIILKYLMMRVFRRIWLVSYFIFEKNNNIH